MLDWLKRARRIESAGAYYGIMGIVAAVFAVLAWYNY